MDVLFGFMQLCSVIFINKYRQVNNFMPGILVNIYRILPKCSCVIEQKVGIIFGCMI